MSGHIAITGCLSTDPTKSKLAGVHTRWEINELQAKHKEQFDLLIRAWANIQARPEKNSQSFFGISSIHGVPFIPWPFEEAGKPTDLRAGYCQHRSVLFPTWHRPYMLLLEQNLQQEAMVLAKQFTGPHRTLYVNAAEQLRLPYWDWASNNSFLPRAALYDQLLVAFPGPNETIVRKRIPNPLLKYHFKDKGFHDKYFTDRIGSAAPQKWSLYFETLRCPDENGISQHDVCDAQLAKNHTVLRNSVFKLMSVNEYAPFSNTYLDGSSSANNYQSLEGIHDTIHVLCGIDPSPLDGHIGDPLYAGYDPLFWLHHSNVDRLYAIWQTLHPGVKVAPQNSKQDTMLEGKNSRQNSKTPLHPFRKPGGELYTSESFENWDSIFNFGYTYPELPAKLLNKDDQAVLKAFATKCINESYAPKDKNYPPVPRAAIAEANEMLRKVPATGSGLIGTIIQDGFQLVTGKYKALSFEAEHHREYIANIRIENFAVDGSFFIHVFLGDYSSDSEFWPQDANLVGTHCVFSSSVGQTACENCLQDKKDGIIVSGGVPLTDALLERGLPDMEPDSVTAYLKEHLDWRVQKADGTVVDNSKIPSLRIVVTGTIVETYADTKKLPLWCLPQILDNVTSGRPGGYCHGDKI